MRFSLSTPCGFYLGRGFSNLAPDVFIPPMCTIWHHRVHYEPYCEWYKSSPKPWRSNECKWVETDSILSFLQVERDDYFGEEIVWIWESNWGLNGHPSGQDAVLHQFLRGEELPGSALQTKTGIFKVSKSIYFITIMFFYQWRQSKGCRTRYLESRGLYNTS